MNIKNLKIGDKIRFSNFTWDYSDDTGTIKCFIEKENKVRILHQSGEIEIDKNLIISKLEPLSAQYKEIKIEHDNLIICHECHKTINLGDAIYIGKEQFVCSNCKNKPSIKIEHKIIKPCVKCGKDTSNFYQYCFMCEPCVKEIDKSSIKINHEDFIFTCKQCNKTIEKPLLKYIYDYFCQKCANEQDKSSIKFSDLKIGDTVKWRRLSDEAIIESKIKALYSSLTKYISFEDNHWCYPENIICKLIPFYKDSYPDGYREMPIEKEKTHSFYCPKCKIKYSIKGNFNHIVEQICDSCKEKSVLPTMSTPDAIKMYCEILYEWDLPPLDKKEFEEYIKSKSHGYFYTPTKWSEIKYKKIKNWNNLHE